MERRSEMEEKLEKAIGLLHYYTFPQDRSGRGKSQGNEKDERKDH
jgi:hypothetical protein